MDGAVKAHLLWVFELLDFSLISNKDIGHHAVNQKHERWSWAMDQGTQAAHHHHQFVFPGGKSKL